MIINFCKKGKIMNWKTVTISPNDNIKAALSIINDNPYKIVFVLGKYNSLLGTVVDGDIRRGLLNGVGVEDKVELVMNKKPISILSNTDKLVAKIKMKENNVNSIPVITEKNIIVDVIFAEEINHIKNKENVVIIMAGGEGSRLLPLTKETPKPMIQVGGKPILETIIEQLSKQGFTNIIISVNYKSKTIKDYFKDGSNWNVDLRYIEEEEKRGTAGCLNLLEIIPKKPFVVINGDILSKVDVNSMLYYHNNNEALATLGVIDYKINFPFGGVELLKGKDQSLVEKPIKNFFINAGVYILDPLILKNIKNQVKIDMTSIFDNLIRTKKKVISFPIHEYWSDIGQLKDLEKARLDFKDNFDIKK